MNYLGEFRLAHAKQRAAQPNSNVGIDRANAYGREKVQTDEEGNCESEGKGRSEHLLASRTFPNLLLYFLLFGLNEHIAEDASAGGAERKAQSSHYARGMLGLLNDADGHAAAAEDAGGTREGLRNRKSSQGNRRGSTAD